MKTGLFVGALCFLLGCQKETVDPDQSSFPNVSGYNQYQVDVNNAVPTLGRVLFYDKRISINNDVSCGSCHKQASGFADNVSLSKGTNGQRTDRNTLAILNNTNPLFWDGRESSLRKMVMQPIMNRKEMGVTNIRELVAELNAQPYYKELSKKAFHQELLTEDNIAEALMWFVRSIVPGSTRFDKYLSSVGPLVPGTDPKPPADFNIGFTSQEFTGLKLFVGKYNCNSCHHVDVRPNSTSTTTIGYYPPPKSSQTPLTIVPFANIGLDFVSVDKGRANVTLNAADDGMFRIPSLRNVELTYPYMHDGRFASLSDVIGHYSKNIKTTPNLNEQFLNADHTARTFDINQSEREALVAFLRTLTDKRVITDPKWSDPFQ